MKVQINIIADTEGAAKEVSETIFKIGNINVTQRKILSFEELSDIAKKRAIDDYRNNSNNFIDDFFSDYDCKMGFSEKEMKEFSPALKKAYKKLGKNKDMFAGDNKCHYDLGRGGYIQFPDLSVDDECFRLWLGVPKKLWKKVNWAFENIRDCFTKLDFEYGELSKTERDILEDAQTKFLNKVKEALEDLRSSYEAQFEDESIIDVMETNDYEFFEDGKRYLPQK